MVALPLSLLFTMAAGCGLAGGEGASTPIPSDGVGHFGASSPIEVCLGTARVVSFWAASTAGAVCVQQGRKGKACSADSACSGIERCVCGRCIVESCEGGGCGEGRVCRSKRCTTACTVDAECPSGEVCATGGCARPCSSDDSCHFGERCDALESVCSTKTCSDAVPCAKAESCEAEEVVGDLHEPEIATIDGVDFAFVEIRQVVPTTASSIYRAKVEQGGRYTVDPFDPVLAAGADGSVGAPSVVLRDGKVELYFAIGAGAAIGRAISSDGGRSFVRDPGVLLSPAAAWEKGWVGSPAAVIRGGDTLLFYEGGPRAGIGLSKVGAGTASRVGDGPVVTPSLASDPLFFRDVSEVGAPSVLLSGDALRLYFTARGAEGGDAIVADASVPSDVNDSIGLVTTRDLKVFTPYPGGPVFARTANLRSYLGEREAFVRRKGAGAEITFVATDASGAELNGLARAGD